MASTVRLVPLQPTLQQWNLFIELDFEAFLTAAHLRKIVFRSGGAVSEFSTSGPGRPDFIDTSGEMAERIATFDWAKTSLGPIDQWPQSLKTITGFLIRSPIPIVLLWGTDGIMIYNDAYSVFAGDRHPEVFGSRVLEGWHEVADFNANVMKVGLAGGTLSYRDFVLTLNRRGKPEPCWLDLDYSPVIDESGQPGGVIAIVVETTERVLAERARERSAKRQRQQFDQAPGFFMITNGPDHVVEFVNDTHRETFGSHDWVGKPILTAFTGFSGPAFLKRLEDVYHTGVPAVFDTAEVRYRRGGPGGREERRFLTFTYAPILDDEGKVTGIFSAGFDVSERKYALAALEEQTRRLETIHRVGSSISTELEAERIVQMITDAGVELTGAEFGAFFYNVIDAEGQRYTLYTLSGVDRSQFDRFPMPRNTEVFAPTFEGKGVVRSGHHSGPALRQIRTVSRNARRAFAGDVLSGGAGDVAIRRSDRRPVLRPLGTGTVQRRA
jgi:PAS domain-containing protein